MSLKEQYTKTVAPALTKELGVKNAHAVPRLAKISVNVGTGSRRGTQGLEEIVTRDLALITGQKPVTRTARKAIAGFKLRAGEVVGYAVTLRGKRMEDFFQRLVTVVLPRIRDFRGLPTTGFDGRGNYSFGVREHTVFPEINQDNVREFYGVGITITTTATDNRAAESLLRALGFPLVKRS
ncbi:MAG: 50S ribosomal protein L5 [Patescibacteria group bacterium]|jgi:large subunit ribosomal protein L5